jgi:hypothetical protein
MDLRRLFTSIFLIAAGLTMVSPLVHRPPHAEFFIHFLIVAICWIGGWGLVGFGLLHPFKRGWIGLLIAVLVQCAIGVDLLNRR